MNIVRFPASAVVFDFFGTLTTATQRGPAHAAIAEGLGCDPAVFAAALDRTFRDRCRGRFGAPADVLLALSREQGIRPTRAALAAAVLARVEAVAADVTLREEAVEVLAALRSRGVRTGLVSDCWYELPSILPTLPIAPLLDATVYSYWLGRCKPDPALYHAVCQRLGVAASECRYLGDGGGWELSGAAAVGMTPVRFAADDLGDHLTFAAESLWNGPAIRNLRDVVLWCDAVPPDPGG